MGPVCGALQMVFSQFPHYADEKAELNLECRTLNCQFELLATFFASVLIRFSPGRQE